MTDNAKELLALARECADELVLTVEAAERVAKRTGNTFVIDRERVAQMIAGRLSARQQASVESLAELIAKRWYWDMHSIMHDHDENWRQFEKRELYLSVARYVVRALLAEYDIFEKVEG
jgi:hypothetical protein